ncbi:hypothetical protein TorRG33x02_149320 [Trema orientale]|uniref:Uncharacterized protein n=1 Tax=Trema orientale TaxID=63057 RepID=A0A2P5EUP0_TREOI|nr:hypothetical protein TorRG33x02_149320 [Trema orientale]
MDVRTLSSVSLYYICLACKSAISSRLDLLACSFLERCLTSSYCVPMVSWLMTGFGQLLVVAAASYLVGRSQVCMACDLEGIVVGLFGLLLNTIFAYWK